MRRHSLLHITMTLWRLQTSRYHCGGGRKDVGRNGGGPLQSFLGPLPPLPFYYYYNIEIKRVRYGFFNRPLAISNPFISRMIDARRLFWLLPTLLAAVFFPFAFSIGLVMVATRCRYYWKNRC